MGIRNQLAADSVWQLDVVLVYPASHGLRVCALAHALYRRSDLGMASRDALDHELFDCCSRTFV